MRLSPHAYGLLLGIIGILLLSPSALLLRLIEAPTMTVTFLRGAPLVLAFGALWLWLRHRDGGKPGGLSARTEADRWAELVFGIFWGAAATLFIFSIQYTYIANTLIIFALIPLNAAIIAIFWLREFPPIHTWLTTIGCLSAVIFIFGFDFNTAHLLGDILSFIATLFVGFNLCLLRRYPRINAIRAFFHSSLFIAFLSLPFADFASISLLDCLYAALLGFALSPPGYFLICYSCRFLQSPEVGLIILLEVPLGTLLAWAVISEVPETPIILSGAVVMSLLTLNFWLSLRRNRLAPALASHGHP